MLSHVVVGLSLHPLELLGGTYDWLILLVVAVLLFGGTRLAGIGKGAGRAIREFKEETGSLGKATAKQLNPTPARPPPRPRPRLPASRRRPTRRPKPPEHRLTNQTPPMSSMAKTRRFDLSWLKPPKPAEDGRMALVDHLREFRYRLIVAVSAMIMVAFVAWYFFQGLFRVVMWPLDQAVTAIQRTGPTCPSRSATRASPHRCCYGSKCR